MIIYVPLQQGGPDWNQTEVSSEEIAKLSSHRGDTSNDFLEYHY